MKKTFVFAALLASAFAVAGPAAATGTRETGTDLSAFGGFGQFGTMGTAAAGSIGGGQAEGFANGSAGLSFSRCGTCNNGSFSGFQNNEAGALTTGGQTFANGFSTGFAKGGAAGGFITLRNLGIRGPTQ